ncbi:hypothetical protein [Vulcanisaeta thermophila]|uniref:hypothetical protein n=1 Tax=Vulcanisaeta thermophila TaxID=867917 RepID=UPI00192E3714|nr:hypothetical protein [Vulcanisaeta thermophila]
MDRREFRSLVRASESLGVRDLMVITWDLEDELTYDKHKIKLTPLHTWLLTTQTQGP